MRATIILVLGAVGIAAAAAIPAVPAGRIVLMADFEPGWDTEWQEQRLARRLTRYRVAHDGDSGAVLRADSHEAAAAFWRRVEAGDAKALELSWRWKISNVLPTAGAERRRRGDDYAARVMVAFSPDFLEPGARALCYVWASGEEVGATYPNPYHAEVGTIVLRNGDSDPGSWRLERRDVLADYRSVFGEFADRVHAVAFVVDTDNTSSRVTSWLDDLVLSVPNTPRP